MPSHQAADQMIGYLYQMRYALFLLLDNDNPSFRISIEKFDDIAFEESDSPKELIQTKHHRTAGNLGDKSVDLWKTINVWLDQIQERPSLLKTCRFLIVTTQTAADNSAASLLKATNRDEEKAIRILRDVAQEHKNDSLKVIYDKFLSVDGNDLRQLFQAVEVVDGALKMKDLEKKLMKIIRFCCSPQYLEKVMDQIEGWWFRHGIKALSSSNYSMPDHHQVHAEIVSVGSQYQPNNLPIEEWEIKDLSEEELKQDNKVFIQQLRLINGDIDLLRRAIKNYYRASRQRSCWIREDLLLPNELEDYEKKLIDEWAETKANMERGNDAAERGRELYRKIMEKSIPIRQYCTEPYVMRGSYQILADKRDVGWHKDYRTLLTSQQKRQETGDALCENGKCALRK